MGSVHYCLKGTPEGIQMLLAMYGFLYNCAGCFRGRRRESPSTPLGERSKALRRYEGQAWHATLE